MKAIIWISYDLGIKGDYETYIFGLILMEHENAEIVWHIYHTSMKKILFLRLRQI